MPTARRVPFEGRDAKRSRRRSPELSRVSRLEIGKPVAQGERRGFGAAVRPDYCAPIFRYRPEIGSSTVRSLSQSEAPISLLFNPCASRPSSSASRRVKRAGGATRSVEGMPRGSTLVVRCTPRVEGRLPVATSLEMLGPRHSSWIRARSAVSDDIRLVPPVITVVARGASRDLRDLRVPQLRQIPGTGSGPFPARAGGRRRTASADAEVISRMPYQSPDGSRSPHCTVVTRRLLGEARG